MKKFYLVNEKNLEISYIRESKKIIRGLTIMDAINEHLGEDEDYFPLIITTDKQLAEKTLESYQGTCRYNPYNKIFLIEYAVLVEWDIEIDEYEDEDERKRLEDFIGVETRYPELKELFNLIQESISPCESEDYNEDFVKRRIDDFD